MNEVDVESHLNLAEALADLLVCAGTGDITPQGNSLAEVGALLERTISEARGALFPESAQENEAVASSS